MNQLPVAICRNCGGIITTDDQGGWVHALPLPSELDGSMVEDSTACRPDFDGSLIADPAEGPHRPAPPVTLNGISL